MFGLFLFGGGIPVLIGELKEIHSTIPVECTHPDCKSRAAASLGPAQKPGEPAIPHVILCGQHLEEYLRYAQGGKASVRDKLLQWLPREVRKGLDHDLSHGGGTYGEDVVEGWEKVRTIISFWDDEPPEGHFEERGTKKPKSDDYRAAYRAAAPGGRNGFLMKAIASWSDEAILMPPSIRSTKPRLSCSAFLKIHVVEI